MERRTDSRQAFVRIGALTLAVALAIAVTAAGSASAFAPTYPAGARTGVARVDWVLRAMQRADVGALYAAIKYRKVPCSTEAGAEVPCKDGEADGTLVEVFSDGTCEPSAVRVDSTDIRAYVERFVESDLRLYAAYQARTPPLPERGGFGIIFAKDNPDRSVAYSIHLWRDGSLESFSFGHCGNRPATIWGYQSGKVLLAPRHR